MTNFSFDRNEQTEAMVMEDKDGLTLTISEMTLLNDINEYLIPIVFSKRAPEICLTVNIQLDSVNTRKAKRLFETINSIRSYFDDENIEVIWHYEATDELSYETGRHIENSTKINFCYQVY